jgi:hypothetical protein
MSLASRGAARKLLCDLSRQQTDSISETSEDVKLITVPTFEHLFRLFLAKILDQWSNCTQ